MASIAFNLLLYKTNETIRSIINDILEDDVDLLNVLLVVWILISATIVLTVCFYGFFRGRKLKAKEKVQFASSGYQHVGSNNELANSTPVETNHCLPISSSSASLQQSAPPGTVSVTPHSWGDRDGSEAGAGAAVGNSPTWLNMLITWLYLNMASTPAWLDAWLSAMNTELDKQYRQKRSPLSLHFDHFLTGSLPPRIVDFHTAAGENTRDLYVYLMIGVKEIGFQVTVTKEEKGVRRPVVCDVSVANMEGEVRLVARIAGDALVLTISFSRKPTMQVHIMPKPGSGKFSTDDLTWLKSNVGSALQNGVTEMTFGGTSPSIPSSVTPLPHYPPPPPAVGGRSLSHSPSPPPSAGPPSAGSGTQQTPQQPRASGAGRPQRQLTVMQTTFRSTTPDHEVPGSREMVTRSHSAAAPGDRSRTKPSISPRQTLNGDNTKTETIVPVAAAQPLGAGVLGGLQAKNLPATSTSNAESEPAPPSAGPSVNITSPASEPRLLVRVIKATGLRSLLPAGGKEVVIVCRLTLDNTTAGGDQRSQETGPIRCQQEGAGSVFWDAQFVLPVSPTSRQLVFEVLSKPATDAGSDTVPRPKATPMLGSAELNLSAVVTCPSSRQILPLRPAPPILVLGSASLTVEVLAQDIPEDYFVERDRPPMLRKLSPYRKTSPVAPSPASSSIDTDVVDTTVSRPEPEQVSQFMTSAITDDPHLLLLDHAPASAKVTVNGTGAKGVAAELPVVGATAVVSVTDMGPPTRPSKPPVTIKQQPPASSTAQPRIVSFSPLAPATAAKAAPSEPHSSGTSTTSKPPVSDQPSPTKPNSKAGAKERSLSADRMHLLKKATPANQLGPIGNSRSGPGGESAAVVKKGAAMSMEQLVDTSPDEEHRAHLPGAGAQSPNSGGSNSLTKSRSTGLSGSLRRLFSRSKNKKKHKQHLHHGSSKGGVSMELRTEPVESAAVNGSKHQEKNNKKRGVASNDSMRNSQWPTVTVGGGHGLFDEKD